MSNFTITLIGISFIFLMTTMGSTIVFFFKKKISDKANTIFLGFASGIMIAASCNAYTRTGTCSHILTRYIHCVHIDEPPHEEPNNSRKRVFCFHKNTSIFIPCISQPKVWRY